MMKESAAGLLIPQRNDLLAPFLVVEEAVDGPKELVVVELTVLLVPLLFRRQREINLFMNVSVDNREMVLDIPG